MAKGFRTLLFLFAFTISWIAFLTPVYAQSTLFSCNQNCPSGEICTCDTDTPCRDNQGNVRIPRGSNIVSGNCTTGAMVGNFDPKDGVAPWVSCNSQGCGDLDGCTCANTCVKAGQIIPFGTLSTCGGIPNNDIDPGTDPQQFDPNATLDLGTGNPGINLSDYFMLNPTQTVASVYDSPAVLINLLVRYAFIFAGLALFFFTLYGGFLFITGNAKGKDKAAEILTEAVIGFVVMFCAYWILQIIQFVTGANVTL